MSTSERMSADHIKIVKQIAITQYVKCGFNYKKAVWLTTRIGEILSTQTPEDSRDVENYFNQMLKKPTDMYKLAQLLRVAFEWSDTPEGHEFWDDIDECLCKRMKHTDVRDPKQSDTTLWGDV